MQPARRDFLKDSVTRQLREAIAAGAWPEHLPSEVALCRELHVSRRTIRAAIAQLIREKWLRSRGRGLSPIILHGTRPAHPPTSPTVIRYLSPRRPEMNDHAIQVVENALREFLGQEGFHLEFECQPDLYLRFSPKRMAKLAELPDTAAWILLHSTREIQEWFATTSHPCVVTGSCHAGVDLPNVEFDYFASCFHAAHLLAGRGEHLVFVAPANLNASEQSAAEGFLAGANKFADLKATVTGHDGTRAGICRELLPLLMSSPRPTGYLVMLPEHTLTVLGLLHSRGVEVPADSEVICRTDDIILEFCVPTVAHYSIDCVKFGHAAGALAVDVIRHGAGRHRQVKILPEFVPGQTLGKSWGKPGNG